MTDLDLVIGAVTIPAVAEQVSHARRLVRDLVTPIARMGPLAREDLEVCTSEVVTNAIKHSRSGRSTGGTVTIIVIHRDHWIRVEVIDDGSEETTVRSCPAPYSVNGRGLLIVEALSTTHGYFTDAAGRCTWFEVAF